MKREFFASRPILTGFILLAVLGTAVLVSSLDTPSARSAAIQTALPYIGTGQIFFWYSSDYLFEEHHVIAEDDTPPLTIILRDMHSGTAVDPKIPVISIRQIPNPKHLSLEEWVKANRASGFFLSPEIGFASTSVGGEHAVSYTHAWYYDYSVETVAVAHKGDIYIFDADSVNPADKLYKDFQDLIKTVHFE